MNNERKILYMSAGINFTIGIITGIILFFGQIRNGNIFSENIYDFDKVVSITDFIRMVWINLVWMFSVIIAHSMLKIKLIHPVLVARGCVNSFSLLYILNCFGIKEAATSIIPQCFTVLPMLIIFSAEAIWGRNDEGVSKSAIAIKKHEILIIFILSLISAGAEILLFRFFSSNLF